MRFDRRLLLSLAIPILLILTVVARDIKNKHSSTSVCGVTGRGATAEAAIQAYVTACGSGDTVSGQGTAVSGQSGYASVRRFKVSESGQTVLVLVGQPTSGGTWATFEVQGLGG